MFEKLLGSLSTGGVKYLVVGGLAVALNGYARNTGDVDILVEFTPANIRALLAALANFGEGAARELAEEDFTPEEGAIRILEAGFSINVFTQMRGHTFADFAPDARSLQVAGQEVRYLSPSALITLKAPSHRDKDQLDVAILREIEAGRRPPEPIDFRSFRPDEAGDASQP